MKRFLPVGLLSLLPTFSQAADRPPFVGNYSLDCGSERQCWLVIDKPRKDAFLAVWTVSGRADFHDLKCGVPLFMRDTEDGFLRAGLDGKAVDIERIDGGGVFERGLPPSSCGLDLTGPYTPVGD